MYICITCSLQTSSLFTAHFSRKFLSQKCVQTLQYFAESCRLLLEGDLQSQFLWAQAILLKGSDLINRKNLHKHFDTNTKIRVQFFSPSSEPNKATLDTT